MITAIGGILIPLCLIFGNQPWTLLVLVFFYSVFSAAAIVAIGGAGITPPLWPASLFTLCFIVSIFSGTRYPRQRPALMVLMPFMLVIAGALVSSVLMPRLFEDEVLVFPQKMTMYMQRSPLAPNAGNYTQDMYLLSNALLTVTASIYLTRPGARLGKLLNCYLSASLVADFVALWQFVGNTAHLWFPSTFFLSNPGWAQLSEETVGSLIRLNGTFSEPSSLSAYLCAAVSAAGWMILKGDQRRFLHLVFWAGLFVVLLCTATTGYVTLAIMCGILVLRSVLSGSARLKQRVAIGAGALVMLLSAICAIGPSVAPGVAHTVNVVIDSTMTKDQSSSYRDRHIADQNAYSAMIATSGLGVGWGSNRSSSLLPGLCASIGLWGIAGFAWFALGLYRQLKKTSNVSTNLENSRVIQGTSASIISTFVSALLSGPTISSPDFFLLLAMLTAASVAATQETGAFRTPLTQRMRV